MIMSNFQCLVLAFLILQIQDIGCQNKDYIVHVSTEVTAQRGLCAHIPCTFTVPSDKPVTRSAKGFWYRPKSPDYLMASNTDYPRQRMFFTGDVSERDCSLFINDVQSWDENWYQFRLQDYEDTHAYSYFYDRFYLRVTELKDKPEISVGKMVAGKEVTITCRSPGVCAGTPPAITWEGRFGEVKDFNVEYNNLTRVYFSNFTFTPSKEDNRLSLVCKVSFLHNAAKIDESINLNVEYPPDVTVTIKGTFNRLSPPPSSAGTDYIFTFKEGEDTMMNCVVDSNPYSKITWFVGDEMKKGPTIGGSLIYSLGKVSLGDAGKYLCIGKNDYGSSSKTIEVIVHYAPRTPNIICQMANDCTIDKSLPIIYVKENSTFSLLCTAESLPEASMSWVKNAWSTIQSKVKGQLTFNYVSLRDEGQYKCIANNAYGKSEESVNIKVTYKPKTVTGRNSSCLEQEGLLECTCIIQSFPIANIKWNIDEKIYQSTHWDNELTVTTGTVKSLTTSTLTCKLSQMNIRNIQCISSNKYGQLDLLLYENRSIKIEIIVAVSCVVVIVLLLAGGFIAVYYFRKRKLSNKPEDKKEIKVDDSGVIYSNSDVHLYGNQTTEIRTNSIYSVQEEDYEDSSYINIEDVQYASVNFSNVKPKHVPEDIETEYAEIKK